MLTFLFLNRILCCYYSFESFYDRDTVLNLSNRNRLKYFAIFKNVEHSLEPCETPSKSASHQALNYVQRS